MSLWFELAGMLSSKKRIERFQEVLAARTDNIIPVFEDMHKPHNAAAVIRTCDALGIAGACFIEKNTDTLFSSGIAKGSEKWVNIQLYQNSDECFSALEKEGYVFVATCFDPEAVRPEELPLDKKIAVVFGNELAGISEEALKRCQYRVCIPMYGFVDSFNISVAAAIILYSHISRLKKMPVEKWQLSRKKSKKTMRRWLFFNTRLGGLLRNKKWRKKLISRSR